MSSLVVDHEYQYRAQKRIALFNTFLRGPRDFSSQKDFASDMAESLLIDIENTKHYKEWRKAHDVLAVKDPWVNKTSTRILPPKEGPWLPAKITRSSVAIVEKYDRDTLKRMQISDDTLLEENVAPLDTLENIKNKEILYPCMGVPIRSLVVTKEDMFPHIVPPQAQTPMPVAPQGGPAGSYSAYGYRGPAVPFFAQVEAKKEEESKRKMDKTRAFEENLCEVITKTDIPRKTAGILPKQTFWDLVSPGENKYLQHAVDERIEDIFKRVNYKDFRKMAESVRGVERYWDFRSLEQMDLESRTTFRQLMPEELVVVVGTWIIAVAEVLLKLEVPPIQELLGEFCRWCMLLTDVDNVLVQVQRSRDKEMLGDWTPEKKPAGKKSPEQTPVERD